MANIMNALAETELTKVIERILISIYLYDEDGMLTKNESQAYTEKIVIKKDICSKSLTQDYADINKYGEGEKTEVSIYGASDKDENAYAIFSVNSIDKISNSLIKYLFAINTLKLSVTGDNVSDVWLNEFLTTAIFSKYSNISLELINSAAEFKGNDIRLNSLSIVGSGSIKLNGSVSVTATNSVNLDNLILSSSKDSIVEFNFMAPNINLNELSILTPITIYTACEKTDTYNEYKTTSCSVNKVSYTFSESDNTNPSVIRDSDDAKMFNNALLSVADFYSATVSGITINDAYCYKGVRFNHLNELHISSLTRVTTKNIGNYTIGISDINRIYLNDINISSGHAYGTNNEYAIFIGDGGLSNLQTLSIDNIKINNLYLMNLGSCNADQISVSNCTMVSETFLQTDRTCNVNYLTFSGLNLTIDHPLNVYCTNLRIYDSNIYIRDLSESDINEFNITESLKIKSSRLVGDESTLKVNMLYDSNFDVSDSEIIFKNFEMSYVENEYEETFTELLSEENKVIYFKNSTITADSKISIAGAYRVSSLATAFNSKEIAISNIDNVSFNEIASTYNNLIKYAFANCNLKGTVLSMRNVASSNSISFDNCSGSLTYRVEDAASETENSSVLSATLKDSNIDLLVDTVGLPIRANLISNNSIGSSVFGNNSSVKVTPSMTSSDIENFNNISELSEIKSDKTNYGNSNTELTVEGLFGAE